MKYRIILLLLTALVLNAHAQLTDWENYTTNGWIRQMAQDGENLWLATNGGLVKYNKQTGEHKLFTHSNSGLCSNDLLSVACHGGKVLVGSNYDGVSEFDGSTFKTYNVVNAPFRSNQAFEEVVYDADGNLWLGALWNLYKYDGTNWVEYTQPSSDISPWVSYNALKFNDDGTLWFGSEGENFDGCFGYLTKEGELKSVTNYNGLYITKIDFDKQEHVWLSTIYDGIAYYDGTDLKLFNSKNSPIPSDNTHGLSIDEDDNVWFGCDNLLFKYDGTAFTSYQVPAGKSVFDLLIDGDVIWVATRGDGLFRFEDGKFERVDYGVSPMTTNGMAFCSAADDKGNVWIGTSESLLKYDENGQWSSYFQKAVTVSNRIAGVDVAADGSTWVGLYGSDSCLVRMTDSDTTYFSKANSPLEKNIIKKVKTGPGNRVIVGTTKGLYVYDCKDWIHYDSSNTPMKSNDIWNLLVDHEGNIWLGADDQGLYKYDGTTWTVFNKDNSPMTTNLVRGLAVDSRNRIWFCCADDENRAIGPASGDGLFCLHGSDWKHWNTKNSPLPSNTIMSIAIDREDRLWLATFGNVGLTCFDGKDSWKVYNTVNSGLANDDIVYLTVDSKRDLLWINQYWSAGISVARLNTSFTAVGAVNGITPALSEGIYDLQGRRLNAKPSKGVYIQNGKKYMVK